MTTLLPEEDYSLFEEEWGHLFETIPSEIEPTPATAVTPPVLKPVINESEVELAPSFPIPTATVETTPLLNSTTNATLPPIMATPLVREQVCVCRVPRVARQCEKQLAKSNALLDAAFGVIKVNLCPPFVLKNVKMFLFLFQTVLN